MSPRSLITELADLCRRNRSASLLFLILLVAALVRLAAISLESLSYDELYTVWAIRLPLRDLIWEVPASGHPPLYYLIAHFWFQLGSGDAWVRSLSLVAGEATVLLIFLTGRELFSVKAGLWGAALAAICPYLIWFSHDATNYSWFIAVSTLSLYMLMRCLRHGGFWNWAGYVLSSVAALFSHHYAAFILIGEIALFLVICRNRKRIVPWLVGQSMVALTLPLWIVYNMGGSSWARSQVMPGLIDTVRWVGLAPAYYLRGNTTFADFSIRNPLLSPYAVPLILCICAGALLVLSPSCRSALANRKCLGLALFTSVAASTPLVLQLFRADPIAMRHYSPAVVGFLLLLGFSLAVAPRKVGQIGGSLIVALLALMTFDQYERANNYDWRGVMAVVSSQRQEGDSLLCFPRHHCDVAQAHYLPELLPVGGGYVGRRDRRVNFIPGGSEWEGYLDFEGLSGGLEPAEGNDIRHRIEQEAGGASRIWLIAGDGVSSDYPDLAARGISLPDHWMLKKEFDITPFRVQLFERNRQQAG